MVRLEYFFEGKKENFKKISIPLWCDWSWTAERLSRWCVNISIPLWCDWSWFNTTRFRRNFFDFNSVMVRLESTSPPLYILKLNEFQFRYGAIGVWLPWAVCDTGTLFQFRYGAIGVFSVHSERRQRAEFQFRYGAIGVWMRWVLLLTARISIPLWCDWSLFSIYSF